MTLMTMSKSTFKAYKYRNSDNYGSKHLFKKTPIQPVVPKINDESNFPTLIKESNVNKKEESTLSYTNMFLPDEHLEDTGEALNKDMITLTYDKHRKLCISPEPKTKSEVELFSNAEKIDFASLVHMWKKRQQDFIDTYGHDEYYSLYKTHSNYEIYTDTDSEIESNGENYLEEYW